MKNILVERKNYEKAVGVIDNIEYSDKYPKMYIEFSYLKPDFDRPMFMLVGDNLLIAMENGMDGKMNLGDKVEFITLRNYSGSYDDEKPIVALSVNGEMLLEFEDGYANFLKWLCEYFSKQ